MVWLAWSLVSGWRCVNWGIVLAWKVRRYCVLPACLAIGDVERFEKLVSVLSTGFFG